MKKIIVIILTLITATAFSGCTDSGIGSPTIWRNGTLMDVTVGDISTITIFNTALGKGRNFSYIFNEKLGILNELTIGEYYEFGIFSKKYDAEEYSVYILVEIYDLNESLVWTCL